MWVEVDSPHPGASCDYGGLVLAAMIVGSCSENAPHPGID